MEAHDKAVSLLVPTSFEPGLDLARDEPNATSRAETEKESARRAPVVFRDHNGTRYLFPYERCQVWSSFKVLIEKAYKDKSEATQSEIREEAFYLYTANDEAILPEVWESVIGTLPLHREGEDTYTVKLEFNGTYAPRTNSREPPDPNYGYGIPEADLDDPGGGEPRMNRSRSRRTTFQNDEDEWYTTLPPVRKRDETSSRTRFRPTPERTRRQETIGSGTHTPSEASRIVVEESDREDDEGEDGDIDYESSTATEDEDGVPEPPIVPSLPPRTVVIPVDRDENPLSFFVDTRWPIHPDASEIGYSNQMTSPKSEDLSKPRDSREMKVESLRILKALSVMSDTRTTIQLHTFAGPENEAMKESVDIHWFHLQGDQLDFGQFKNACLAIQGLPERLRRLTSKTLGKVEKEKLKAFLDGMFIEPGTVLRGDEKHSNDPYSVIFSCVPHFDVQPPFRPPPGRSLHPPRSLMQSYYPYEPVKERDMEQVFKKSGNGSSNNIIQVPSLWMMNIGTHAVVTCGYRPLSNDFVKSITLLQEDFKSLATTKGNGVLNIRLTDWSGRVLLYAPAECRSYFEMEQKIRELMRYPRKEADTPTLKLAWNTKLGKKKVTPGTWVKLLKSGPLVFIDLSTMYEKEAKKLDDDIDSQEASQPLGKKKSTTLIPPFFYWPVSVKVQTELNGTSIPSGENENTAPGLNNKPSESLPPEIQRSTQCMETVEKAMLTEVIGEYDTQHLVDREFTTTKFYLSLPEETLEVVQTCLDNLSQSKATAGMDRLGLTMHQFIIETQCSTLAVKTSNLVETIKDTLMLFDLDVNKSPMLRKLWGAMKNVVNIAIQVEKRCFAYKPDPNEYTDPEWKSAKTGNRKWSIRTPTVVSGVGIRQHVYLPDGNAEFVEVLRRCRFCRHHRIYTDPQAALNHLEEHIPANITTKQDLKSWIRNDGEALVEDVNAGYLAIITQTSEAALSLLSETKQLADGVQIEEGIMSELYTLPHELAKTLRKLIVFYLAIERAFHHTEICFDRDLTDMQRWDVPFSDLGLGVLQRFCESGKSSLLIARNELCNMARSPVPDDISKRLVLGPEYICSWFMRRLLVKPLNNSMTAADVYREYLLTLQFQVNHRPGKRLLRSINLLQEELTALEQVNSWQTKLIDSYCRVLDDTTYQVDIPSRRTFFRYERLLLDSCLDNLGDMRDDYRELIRRCGPLSDSTKQSAEINEEDHGKAIFVFTVVTVIFMPLSFVTSYLGMNTSDIRNMDNTQSLFWIVALPLTVFTMGSILYLAYMGDDLRDTYSYLFKRLTGQQDASATARGISVAQRKRAQKNPTDSSSTLDYRSLADEAEFASPRAAVQTGLFGERNDVFGTLGKKNEHVDTTTFGAPMPISYNDHYVPSHIRDTALPPMMARSNRIAASAFERPPEPYHYVRRARKPPPPPIPGLNLSNPVRMKVKREHLEPATLINHNIPYEVDRSDPDYLILLKYLDETELNVLFEHTRRWRERALWNEEDDRYANDRVVRMYELGEDKPKEYEWVRKSERRAAMGDRDRDRRGGTRHRKK
ncbi:hypothetical protein K504DRAFT_460110 [Pleomassaria siparia CBS 279.74]|uniref:Ubiquitin-like domain-containing protein n=1 Tax=Pleomassaria siparia CBS 279.74 TaxID=1314801 RepID=A0A6G1K0N6_9PLEO|nr:hypothetical protein K504DRAFT_460110 [Pleomassaria siparia CBS 279.74]